MRVEQPWAAVVREPAIPDPVGAVSKTKDSADLWDVFVGHGLSDAGRRGLRHNSAIVKAFTKDDFIQKIRAWGYEGAPTYLKKVWQEYAADIDFTKALNRWLDDGRNGNKGLREIFTFAHNPSYKDNLVFLTTADKRQGKSTLVRKCARIDAKLLKANIHWHLDPANVAEITDETLDGDFTRWVHVYIVIGFQDAPRVLPLMNAHDWLIVDELPEMQSEGSVKLAKSVRNLIKIASGKRQLNFAIINQYYEFIEGVQFVLRVIATDRQHFKTLAVLQIQAGAGKVLTDGVIDLNVAEPDEIHAPYEKHNDEVKAASQLRGGTQTIEIDLADVTRVVEATHHMTPQEIECIGNSFGSEKALAAFVDIRADLADISDHPRKASIVVLALNKIRMDAKQRASGGDPSDDDAPRDPTVPLPDPGSVFKFDVKQALYDYQDEFKLTAYYTELYRLKGKLFLSEREADVLEQIKSEPGFETYAIKDTVTNDVVVRAYTLLHDRIIKRQTVSDATTKVSDWLYSERIGKDYEKWCEAWYCNHEVEPDEVVKRDGRTGFPDITITRQNETVFVACKSMHHRAEMKSYSVTDLLPETLAAQNLHAAQPSRVVKVLVDFYCTINDKRQIKVRDYLNPGPETFWTGIK